MTDPTVRTDPGVIAAAITLCHLLEQENAALRAVDLAAATALLNAKLAATETLVAAQRRAALSDTQAGRAAGKRLQGLAATNKQLLETALLVQDRVLACIARAMPRAAVNGGRYGARGGAAAGANLPPVALSARA